MPHTTRQTVFGAAATLALALALSASPVLGSDGVATLGSPPPDEGDTGAAAVPTDPMDGMLDYAACMREQGIDMPDPQTNGGGFALEFEGPADGDIAQDGTAGVEDIMGSDFIAADEACSHHLGAMASSLDPALEAELMEQMLAHVECMREHGIKMDDPDISGGAVAFMMESDPFSDEYRAADEACRDVLPFGEEMGFSEIGG